MFFVYKKLAQFAVRCALPPRRSESPVCATDNKPSCVLQKTKKTKIGKWKEIKEGKPPLIRAILKRWSVNYLPVQWLEFCSFRAECPSLIPGGKSKIAQAAYVTWPGKKKGNECEGQRETETERTLYSPSFWTQWTCLKLPVPKCCFFQIGS